MFATMLGWLTTASFPNFVYVAGLALVLAEAMFARWLLQRERARCRTLDTLDRTIVGRYSGLRASLASREGGDTWALADPEAVAGAWSAPT